MVFLCISLMKSLLQPKFCVFELWRARNKVCDHSSTFRHACLVFWKSNHRYGCRESRDRRSGNSQTMENPTKISKKHGFRPETRFGERGTKSGATLSRSSSLVTHFEKTSSTMEVGNRDIGRLALEKCQNPSGKIGYLPDTRFGERGTKFMTTLARSGPLVIHFEKTSSTMDVGNRDIGGLALEKYRNLTSLFNLVNSFNELCVFAVCCPTKFMTCSLIIFNSDRAFQSYRETCHSTLCPTSATHQLCS